MRKRNTNTSIPFASSAANGNRKRSNSDSKGEKENSHITIYVTIILVCLLGVGLVEFLFVDGNVHPSTTQQYKRKMNGPLTHVTFSTDCGSFQHWQSYLLFYSAHKVGQHEGGTVTRIASGCSDEQQQSVQKWHDEHVSGTFGAEFMVHFTPHFSSVKDKDGNSKGEYKFFNKPLGIRHFFDTHYINGDLVHDEDIVALIDPDMILLKKIGGDFSTERDVIFSGRVHEHEPFVKHGVPFGQHYGLGAQWRKFNLDEIAGPDSPAKKVSMEDAFKYYPVGPPYIATARDLHSIAVKWCEFVPKVHAEYPYLLAEMYAYCIAAAHLELPHQRADNLMVSNTGANGEAWPFVDAIGEDVSLSMCEFATAPIDDKQYPIPTVIHFCQRYVVSDFIFWKRKVKENFFECDSKPFEELPSSLAEDFSVVMMGEGKYAEEKKKIKRSSFMLCSIQSMMNGAQAFYKQNHCTSTGDGVAIS